MAIDKSKLTREWIQYLKNNKIVALQSDPSTGKLNYKKKVTIDDLTRFLELKTDFNEEEVGNAIHMVLARKAQSKNQPALPGKQPGTAVGPVMQPQQRPKQIPNNKPIPVKKKYSKDDAEDIDFRDINEALSDNTSLDLDESDVESIFSILLSGKSAPQKNTRSPGRPPAQANADDAELKKLEDVRRLKRVIRDTMTPAQRKALWRLLTDA